MDAERIATLRRGVEAGLLASVPQVLVPQLEEHLLDLPPGTANVGTRFVRRMGERLGARVSERTEWLGASVFHFGYAAFWGGLYATAYRRRPVHPLVGGAALAGLIYGMTFTPWGGAVRTGTEPRRRNWKHTLLLASAPAIFGLGTALLYGRGPKRRLWGWRAL